MGAFVCDVCSDIGELPYRWKVRLLLGRTAPSHTHQILHLLSRFVYCHPVKNFLHFLQRYQGVIAPNQDLELGEGYLSLSRHFSGLQILIDASNGASDYGNKFGEPLIQVCSQISILLLL